MTLNEGDVRTLRRYLLGGLAPDAQARLETRLMTDTDDLDDLVRCAEDELIDDFVRGDLSTEDRESFRQRFFNTAERRSKVAFARALERSVERRTAAEAPPARSRRRPRILAFRPKLPAFVGKPAWGLAMAAALTAVAVGAAWLFVGYHDIEGELAELESERRLLSERVSTAEERLAAEQDRSEKIAGQLEEQRSRSAELRKELDSVRAAPTLSAIASVWLSPGLVRGGGEIERVILPAELSLVRLLLDLGIDDYPTYRAALLDADGGELWTQAKLEAESLRGRVAVAVTLPASLLPAGDYVIRLSGVTSGGDSELVGRYYLRALTE